MAKTKKVTAKKNQPAANKKKNERRSKKSSERRESDDRRQADVQVVTEKRISSRRKVQRRHQIDPTTCERDYTDVEVEFMHAMDEYKRANGRMFPTCSEILEVLRDLGYEKTANKSTASNLPAGKMVAGSSAVTSSSAVAGSSAVADSSAVSGSEEPASESLESIAVEMEI